MNRYLMAVIVLWTSSFINAGPVSDITNEGSTACERVARSRATLCAGSNVRGGH